MDVFLLWHVRHAKNLDGSAIKHRDESGDLLIDEECDDIKILGVYSSEVSAIEAIDRARAQQGFRDEPDCFHTDCYTVGEDLWTEGFVTIPDDQGDGDN